MKNYLIIGASSGIGKSLAEHLASDGNRVFGTYNSHEIADANNISYHHLDVTQDTVLDFLPDSLDGLAYCPGSINL